MDIDAAIFFDNKKEHLDEVYSKHRDIKLVKIPDRENGTIEGFLTRQITYMDEGYRCNCYKTIYYDNRHELKNIPCRCVCDNEKKARAKNCSCTSDELKSNNGNL